MRCSGFFLATSLLCLLAFACSSGDGDAPAGPAAATDPGATDPKAPQPPPEAPLRARTVCNTIEAGPSFSQGCSGSGSGDALCVLEDLKCGTDSCVYDSRGDTFSFYCAPSCTVGDATRCPLGFECVDTSASCGGGGEGGVCAKRAGFGCDESVSVTSGKFFDGPGGELYHLAGTSSPQRATLSVRSGNSFKTVSSWDGDASVRALVRNGESLLLVTGDFDVLIKAGKATAKKRSTATGYAVAYGVAKDGAFVQLDGTGAESFAALSRRGDDGAWTEVGPTRQRVTKITSLGTGFLAVCQKTLCASGDGETFTPVALPDGVTFDDKTVFAAAGASVEDFFFATGGVVRHTRKGIWVEEGPRGLAPEVDAGSYRREDVLRTFADGTAVFHTWNGKAYSTYVYGEDCWAFTAGGNLDNADLVKGKSGNSFVWADSYEKALCTTPAR